MSKPSLPDDGNLKRLPSLGVKALRQHLRPLCDWTQKGGWVSVAQRGDISAVLCPAGAVPANVPSVAVPLPEARNALAQTLVMAADQAVMLTVRGQPHAALVGMRFLPALPVPALPKLLPTELTAPVQEAQEGTMLGTPRMKVISLWNAAGGATKTTMVAEISQLIAARRRPDGQPNRVLMIDLDPQCSLTHRMGITAQRDAEGRSVRLPETAYLMMQEADVPVPAPLTPTRLTDLRIIPSHPNLQLLDGMLLGGGDEMTGVLRQSITQYEGDFDYVLIDTPPSNGGLTRAALTASTNVVVPASTMAKSLENIRNVASVMEQCRRQNPDLELSMFIPTAYNKGRGHDRDVLQTLRERFSVLAPISSVITERAAIFRDVPLEHSVVSVSRPRNPAVEELNTVVDELLSVIHRAAPQLERA